MFIHIVFTIPRCIIYHKVVTIQAFYKVDITINRIFYVSYFSFSLFICFLISKSSIYYCILFLLL